MQDFITNRLDIFDPRVGEIVFTRLFFVFFRLFVCGFFRQAIAQDRCTNLDA